MFKKKILIKKNIYIDKSNKINDKLNKLNKLKKKI